MTVCIAALAEKRKKAVLVADRMITAKIPIGFEFETDEVRKISELSDDVYALTAGDTLASYKILENCRRELGQQLKPPRGRLLSVQEIAEIVRVQYQNYRRDMVVKKFLEPRGMNLDYYHANQQRMTSSVVNEVEDQLLNYDINVEFIIAGYDVDEHCHLYTITHPGLLTTNDALGYVSVGSGAPHAMYSMIDSSYSKDKSLEDVKKMVLDAKKKSEKAPGVGELTTIKIIPSKKKNKSP